MPCAWLACHALLQYGRDITTVRAARWNELRGIPRQRAQQFLSCYETIQIAKV